MSLEKLLIYNQGISFHRKHINTLDDNPNFIKFQGTILISWKVFSRKNNVIYSLKTPNLLTLPKLITKRFGLNFF